MKLEPKIDKIKELEKIKERFWKKVDIKDDNSCWEWLASTGGILPYGHFNYEGCLIHSHRVAYILTYGQIPHDKPIIMHKCDNSLCCNPKHLCAGTYSDNNIDKFIKGRDNHVGANNPNVKLSLIEVHKIRELYSKGKISQSQLTEKYGVNVSDILSNRSWVDENYKPTLFNNSKGENHPNSKLTLVQIKEIRDRYKNGESISKLSIEFNQKLQRIIKNERYKDNTYKPVMHEHVHSKILTLDKVKEIREKHSKGATLKELCKEYNICSTGYLSDIIHNKKWKEV